MLLCNISIVKRYTFESNAKYKVLKHPLDFFMKRNKSNED